MLCSFEAPCKHTGGAVHSRKVRPIEVIRYRTGPGAGRLVDVEHKAGLLPCYSVFDSLFAMSRAVQRCPAPREPRIGSG